MRGPSRPTSVRSEIGVLIWRDLDVLRGETQVLWGVSLDLKAGERVAVLGGNGAGKSTLLSVTVGALPFQRGEINFKGVSLRGMRPHQIIRLGLALVPEGRRVYRAMSVWENLQMGAYPKRGRDYFKDGSELITRLFPILKKRKNQRAGTLSGGEQQMLAIGRALMSRPEALLIDELSLGLAPIITREIYRALDALPAETTIMLVEQNVEQALKHSHRAYVLENGRIVKSGASADLARDDHIRKAYMGL